MPPFDSLSMVSYSTSLATMAVSRTVSEIHGLIGQKLPNFLIPLYSGGIGAPVMGEAVGVKQQPSCRKTRMMGLSGGKRISTKRLAVLIQSTRVSHRHTYGQTYRQTEMP